MLKVLLLLASFIAAFLVGHGNAARGPEASNNALEMVVSSDAHVGILQKAFQLPVELLDNVTSNTTGRPIDNAFVHNSSMRSSFLTLYQEQEE
mmetsp:Transcript_101809/g.185840  ORF Transcript_101809/g.185840 Transcript_101809/m.185840 type:complete len:93 (+) Transcript_101809:45-323(+)